MAQETGESLSLGKRWTIAGIGLAMVAAGFHAMLNGNLLGVPTVLIGVALFRNPEGQLPSIWTMARAYLDRHGEA